jgi:UDP-N-acetylmuramate dehydrogenase
MLARLHEQYPLHGWNSFGVEARARWFCRVRSTDDLAALTADPRFAGLPRLVLGGGSNLLLTRDFDGLVIKVEVPGLRELGEAGDAWHVEVGAGENWHATVERLLTMGRPGLENLALIPGSCGAAPVQNIGAYGLELAQRFDSLAAWDFACQRLVHMTDAECAFGYRDSLFKHALAGRYLILSVTLALPKRWRLVEGYADVVRELKEKGVTRPDARAIFDAVVAIRRRKLPDPAVIGNAGSLEERALSGLDEVIRCARLQPWAVCGAGTDMRADDVAEALLLDEGQRIRGVCRDRGRLLRNPPGDRRAHCEASDAVSQLVFTSLYHHICAVDNLCAIVQKGLMGSV